MISKVMLDAIERINREENESTGVNTSNWEHNWNKHWPKNWYKNWSKNWPKNWNQSIAR